MTLPMNIRACVVFAIRTISHIVLFYLLSTCKNKGEVINHMLNRFPMLSKGVQGYDSLLVLSSKANKQLQSNLSSFNSQFHNVMYPAFYHLDSMLQNSIQRGHFYR